MDGLCNSQKFDLLLGYFSSAAINVLSLGFATFLYSGGTVRLVVNNILSQVDRDAIKAGREGEIIENAIDLTDIKNKLSDRKPGKESLITNQVCSQMEKMQSDLKHPAILVLTVFWKTSRNWMPF